MLLAQAYNRAEFGVAPAEELDRGGVLGWSPTPGGSRTAFAWTPAGDALVFVGRRGGTRQLFVRHLAREEALPLTGTEGAQVPAVSADGRWVAFWAGGVLKKVPTAGGPAVQIVSEVPVAPTRLGWGTGDTLFFSASSVIWKVDGSGPRVQVTTLGETEQSHVLPWLLPGARVVLFTARKRWFTTGDEEIVAYTLATGARKVVLRDASDARYLSTGHLVFLRRGVLWAVPFDAESVQLRGTEVPLVDGVAQSLTGETSAEISHAGQFAVSATGTLAWLRGSFVPPPAKTLVVVDRHGQVTTLNAPARSYGTRVRLSPNREELIVNVDSGRDVGLWRHNLARGTLTPLLQEGEATFALWTPDGRHIVFSWFKDARHSLTRLRADGSGPPQILVKEEIMPSSWSRDGKELVGLVRSRDGSFEGVMVSMENGRAAVKPLVGLPKGAWSPMFSPDGRWLAYSLNDSGRWEVYIQLYPGPGPRTQVSVAGGRDPCWAADGRRLYFVTEDAAGSHRHMMEVDLQLEPTPHVGTARELFPIPAGVRFGTLYVRGYDVAPDGQRFYALLTPTPPPPPAVGHINLIQNRTEELKEKVPAVK